jgi:hypothetical protein
MSRLTLRDAGFIKGVFAGLRDRESGDGPTIIRLGSGTRKIAQTRFVGEGCEEGKSCGRSWRRWSTGTKLRGRACEISRTLDDAASLKKKKLWGSDIYDFHDSMACVR